MNTGKLKKIFASVLSVLMLVGSTQPVYADPDDESNQTGVSVQLLGGASKEDNENNTYVWNADTNSAGHRLTFRVNYNFSSTEEIPEGKFTIRVPSSILKDRDDNPADAYEMSLPTKQEADDDPSVKEQNQYAYYTDDDKKQLVIYNCKPVTDAVNAYFEVAYRTTESTFNYRDNSSYTFNATAQFDGQNPVESDDLTVSFNTGVKIKKTEILKPTLYRTWDSSWGNDLKPENDGDYEYLLWPVRSYIEGFTQPYTISLENTLKGSADGDVNVVGYKFAGNDDYSSKNSASNQKNDQYRTDYVLTRYLKDKYNPSDDTKHVDRFTIDNKVNVTVHPDDETTDEDTKATASRTYLWEKPDFTPVFGHFYEWHHGDGTWDSNKTSCDDMTDQHPQGRDYESYNLEQFQNGKIDTLPDLRFITHSQSYLYPWTLGAGTDENATDGISKNDPYDYGIKPTETQLSSDKVYLENFDTTQKLGNDYQFGSPLTADDYNFDYISAYITNDIRTYDADSKSFVSTRNTCDENDIYHFYAKFGDGDWTEVGTYRPLSDQFEVVNEYQNLVSEFGHDPDNSTRIRLKFANDANATGWRITVSNAHYSTHFYVESFLNLKNSKKVLKYVDGKESINVSNVSELKCFDSNGQIPDTIRRWDFDRVTRMQRGSSLRKTVVSTANNTRSKNYSITWKLAQDETTQSDGDQVDHVVQNGGIFYDLLPEGSTLDKKSILVYANYGSNNAYEMPSSAYTVETEDDYGNSGRTLVKITIRDPAENYMVFYDSIHDWDSINDFGRDVLNPVAYETGNESIANGYFDNPTHQDSEKQSDGLSGETNQRLFKHLDTEGDEDPEQARFIYAEDKHDITALTAAAAGLSKRVKGSKDDTYSQNAYVGANENYTYRLRFMNAYTNTAKHVVLYDSIENYKPGEWKGTPVRLDVSKIEDMGIQPKVYISTTENLDIDGHRDLSDASVWTLTTDLNNISNAKAIAIDLSQNNDGTEYVLPEGKSVSAYLYMKAPGTESVKTSDNTKYPKTYNNVYVSDVLSSSSGSKDASYFIHQDYTTVNFKVSTDFNLKKVSSQNQNLAISNITYRLKGTSDYGTETDRKEKTDRNGSITFDDVEKGTYTLSEYESTPDWQLNTDEYQVLVGADRSVTIDGKLLPDKTFVVRDDPRIHNDVTFTKFEMTGYHEAGDRISGTRFLLTGMSDYGNQITRYATSGGDGSVTLKDIEKGTYTLKEIETGNEKYILPKNLNWTVRIDDEGNPSITSDHDEYVSRSNNGDITLYNEKYHSFKLVKWDSNKQNVAGVTFKLTGSSEFGTPVNEEETTDAYGIVTFKDLEAGNYVVQEISVPAGISLDDTRRIVQIDQYDNIKIEGLKENKAASQGGPVAFDVIDMAVPTGTVKIIKKWKGKHDTGKFPTIYVSETIPEDKIPHATIDKNSLHNYLTTLSCKNFEKLPDSQDVNQLNQNYVHSITDTSNGESSENYYVNVYFDPLYLTNPDQTLYWFSNVPITRLPSDCSYLFSGTALKKINLTGLDWSEVTNTNHMFYNNVWINRPLDLGNINTSNVTDMSSMFEKCYITTLNAIDFDTSNVTNMSNMFKDCNRLTTLDHLSSFDTSQVTNMSGMFSGCSKLTTLDVGSFETSQVTDMSYMFNQCSGLSDLDLSSFDTSKVTDMSRMFSFCSSLSKIYVSDKWNTNNVTSSDWMFAFDTALTGYASYYIDKTCAYAGGDGYGYLTNKASITANAKVNEGFNSVGDRLTSFGNNIVNHFKKLVITDIDNETVTGEQESETDAGENEHTYKSDSNSVIDSTSTAADIQRISNNENGYWDVRNDDEWVYYFPVFTTDENTELYYWEEPMHDYTTSYEGYESAAIANGGVTKNHEGVVVNTSNSDPEAVTGGLKVSKNVTVNGNENNGYTNQQFTFNVTLTNSNDQPLTGTTVYGDTVFTDGKAVFNLTGGGAITFTDIPVEYHYSVTEDTPAGFTVSSIDDSGTISKENVAEASFTNAVKGMNPDNPNEPIVNDGKFTLTKVVNANGSTIDQNASYSFNVLLNGLTGGKTYSYKIGDKSSDFTADITGTVNVQVALKNGESVNFVSLPDGATYQITETGGDYIPSYVINASDNSIVQSKESTGKNQDLTTDTMNVSSAGATVTFTNTLDDRQDLTISKKVTGEDGDRSYNITVDFSNLKPGTRITSDAGAFTEEDGTASKTLSLKKGESVKIHDIPVGTKYTVTEAGNPAKPSYVIMNGEKKIDEGTGEPRKDLATKEQTVNKGVNAEVTFTNNFVENKLYNLSVTDKTGGNFGDKEKYFKYTLMISGLETNKGYDINGLSPVTSKKTSDKKEHENPNRLRADEDGKTDITFWLKDGETVTFPNLPENAKYTISEDPENYSLEIKNTTPSQSKRRIMRALAAVTDGKNSTSGTMNQDVSYTFTNTLNASVPTGINEKGNPWIMIIGLIGIAGFVIYRKTKHSLKS